ncbi:hypothetical protein SXCC_01568 [Gluconacetobacter sp. SXCC-1]|nr:hypothetical protein SXCC_01568 [Gluconacetobacter sp. SXCC-1]
MNEPPCTSAFYPWHARLIMRPPGGPRADGRQNKRKKKRCENND